MLPFVLHLRVHPRLVLSLGVGLTTALAWPYPVGGVERALIGWNAAVWLYLALVGWTMVRADHHLLRRVAKAQAESAATVMALVSAASVASLAGVVFELTAAKLPGVRHALPHVVLALVTVVGAWLLIPTVFALTYASLFCRTPAGEGLKFPGDEPDFHPDYGDFLYFAFTIAVASQTADISVTTQVMRRLVLLQSVLAFGFNTAVLAFTVNLAASMF